jgi:hypothetical protein
MIDQWPHARGSFRICDSKQTRGRSKPSRDPKARAANGARV